MSLREPYREFFQKTEAGKLFMAELDRLITENHAKAESDPDHSRDYAQRACGVREVLTHITVNLVAPKKGKSSR